MNQLHASGKNIFKSRLKQDLKSQINKIQELKEIYQEEKNNRTSTLKKTVQRKLNQSEFFNF